MYLSSKPLTPMKSKTYEKAIACLHIRMRPSEKEKLLQKANEVKCSITEIVLAAINHKSNHVYGDRKTFIASLHLLSSEIHRIGVNINQVVHLMHQDKLTGHIHTTSLHQFNQLLKNYQQLLDEVRSLFQKIVSHEQTGI